MWFGDERGYNATRGGSVRIEFLLWFGDERGYNATKRSSFVSGDELWFGDERGYNATRVSLHIRRSSCGLVMKEDITQQPHIYEHCKEVVVW